MGMNHKRLEARILASYATGIRGDLDIADFQKLDSISAHVLLEFSNKIGKPSADDVERYFHKNFEGRILPVMASMSVKPDCVSIIAQLNVPTRDFADTNDKTKMTPIVAGLMYMDSELNQVWQVRDDNEGKKVLARESKDNIDQIIAARRNRMFVTESPKVSLASVATAKTFLTAGCTVKAWHQGKIQSLILTEQVKGGFKVKNAEGKESVVAAEGIVDLQQMADAGPNETSMIQKYFETAYGDKNYAKQLVKK